MRGNRDWYPRGSPQGMPFNSYRNMEDDFYMKEQMYKSEKPPRPPYQRHEAKSKRRDGGDYHSKSRHSESEMTEEPFSGRAPEDRRQSSPARGRSKKPARRHATVEKQERENATENDVSTSKSLYINTAFNAPIRYEKILFSLNS